MSAHCCTHEQSESPDRRQQGAYRRVLWVVLVLNAAMFLVELVAGLTAGSVSLMADAVDVLADAGTYGITLFVVGMALRYRAAAAMVKGAAMGLFGLWVLGATVWHALAGTLPDAVTMGAVGAAALATNAAVFALLWKYRAGDSTCARSGSAPATTWSATSPSCSRVWCGSPRRSRTGHRPLVAVDVLSGGVMRMKSCATICLVAISLLPVSTSVALAQTPSLVASLEDLVTLALARNAELQSVRQRVAEAEGTLRQAGLRPRPSFSVDVTSGRPFGSPGEREVSVGYAHTFELGGKRDRRLDVAELGLEQAGYEVLHREREIVTELRVRHAEAIAARRNLEIAQQLFDLAEQSLVLIGHRVRTGDASSLDEGLLQVEVARLLSARVTFEGEAERALLNLKTLAGLDPAATLTLADGSPAPGAAPLPVETAVALAIEQRADLQAARLVERRAAAAARLAQAGAVPDLIGSLRYAQGTSRFDQFGLTAAGALTELRDTDRVLSAGVTISLPIGDRNQGNIQAALARAEAARLHREFLEEAVRSDVHAALARDRAARQAAEIFARQVTGQSTRNLELMRASYELGETRLLDFITEQRRSIDVQQAYTDILREQAVAHAELERALGTTTEDLP